MEAALTMFRQAADLRAAWHRQPSYHTAAADALLSGYIRVKNLAASAMLEAMRPIGATW